MGYKIIEKEWNETTGDYYCKFICDTVEDIADLPACNSGSVAVVVAEGSPVHVVNASGEWKEISSANGGGSSGGEGESNPLDAYIEGTTTELTSNAKSVGAEMFYSKYNDFTSINFPQATSIGPSAFRGSTYLKTANFPQATEIMGNAFNECKLLETINFPLVNRIGVMAFANCTSLSEVNFPCVTIIERMAFSLCSNLKTAIFPKLSAFIEYEAFIRCFALDTLVLGSEILVPLNTVNHFQNTPFAIGGTGGTVYVPQALIEEYKTATNWSTFYEGGTVTFAPIEGSEFE